MKRFILALVLGAWAVGANAATMIALLPGAGAEINNYGIFDASGNLLNTVTHPDNPQDIVYNPATGDVYAYLADGVYRNGSLLFLESGTLGAQNQASNIAVSSSGLIALLPGAGVDVNNYGVFDASGNLLNTVAHPDSPQDIVFDPENNDVYAYLADGVYRNGSLLFLESGTLGAQGQFSNIAVSSSGVIALMPGAGVDINKYGLFDQFGNLLSLVTLPDDIHDVVFDPISDDVYAYLADGVYLNGELLFPESGTFGAQNQASNIAVFSTVPIPATVWLFGSALVLLGWIRKGCRK